MWLSSNIKRIQRFSNHATRGRWEGAARGAVILCVDRNGRGSVVLGPGRPRVTLSTRWAGPPGAAYATLATLCSSVKQGERAGGSGLRGVGTWPLVAGKSPAHQVVLVPRLEDSLQCGAHLPNGLFSP